MRGGILAIGIILLILGLILFFTGNNMIKEVEAYNILDLPISEFLKLIDEGLRIKYETGQSYVMFGSIFGIVGFIICIAGMVATKQKEQSKTNVSTPSTSTIIKKEESKEKSDESESKKASFCSECGEKLKGKPKFCPFCGTKQEEAK